MVGAICLAALAMAVVAGVWAGHAVAPGERVEPAAVRVVRAGAATLVVPGEWQALASRGTGVAAAPAGTTAVLAPSPGLSGRVIVTVAPADDRSLVPGALRGLVRDLGRGPRVTRLAGYRAWRYAGLLGRKREEVLDVTVLPTSAGVLGVACTSAAWAASAMADCASSIGSVSMSGAAMLVPSRDLALRLKLPRVLATLDRTRIRSRAALGRSDTGAGQARLARRLAREHLDAADSLRPVAGRAGGPLLDDLSTVAGAYLALGRAASAGSASRFHVARGTVETAEAELARAIDRFVARDAHEAAVARPTPSSPRRAATGTADVSRIVLTIVGFVGLLAVGLVLGVRGSFGWAASRLDRRDFTGPDQARSGRDGRVVRDHAIRWELVASRVPAPAAPVPEPSPLRGLARSPDPPAPPAAAWSDAPSPTPAACQGRPAAASSGGWDAPPTPPPGPCTAGVGAAGSKAASGPVSP